MLDKALPSSLTPPTYPQREGRFFAEQLLGGGRCLRRRRRVGTGFLNEGGIS